ncbi:MAG: hypothetical protein EBW36_03455 [Actinobacteria bacterium]|nr:hypothetical protein [Actinomycetota bacterium]
MSEVVLPALGESVTEGTVTRWLKKVGDTVAVDEPLVEVSTDKVDTEIPSPVAGVLQQILVQEDETIEVGAVLAVVGDGARGTRSPSGSRCRDPSTYSPSSCCSSPSGTCTCCSACSGRRAGGTTSPSSASCSRSSGTRCCKRLGERSKLRDSDCSQARI